MGFALFDCTNMSCEDFLGNLRLYYRGVVRILNQLFFIVSAPSGQLRLGTAWPVLEAGSKRWISQLRTPSNIRAARPRCHYQNRGKKYSCGFSHHRRYNLYDLTKPVVYGERGSRRLAVDCSTGRRPMERADEPPPPILLYQVGFGCILKWWCRSGWVGKRKGPR